MTKPSGESHDHLSESIRKTASQASELQASFQRAGSVAGASYSLIGAIILLGGGGYFADQWLGTSPWMLIGGLLLGVIVGFYELARVVWRRTP